MSVSNPSSPQSLTMTDINGNVFSLSITYDLNSGVTTSLGTGYQILNISGSVSGNTNATINSQTPFSYNSSNNLYYPTAKSQFDLDGVSFQVNGHNLNLYSGTNNQAVSTDGIICFLKGTLIVTNKGEVQVEDLKIGDLIPTLSGEIVPIKWIGYQKFDTRFLNQKKSPVLFKKGSLGYNVPRRDLYVSAAHAMFFKGIIIDAAQLVNGISIIQEKINDVVEFYNIDLGEHHCIQANGAWAESYRETNNRGAFDNFNDYLRLYPQEIISEVEQEPCFPHINSFEDPRLPDLLKEISTLIPQPVKLAV